MALNGKYLEEAERLLKSGDYVQASEKFWGAVAEMVKVVATHRRWRHYSHNELRSAVEKLYKETGDRELLTLFSVAEALHANLYENFMSGEVVEAHADDALRLVAKLQSLATCLH